MIKGAIFDLDGTLLDSMYAWFDAGEKYLEEFGLKARDDLTESIKSMSLLQASAYLKEQYFLEQSVEEIMEGITKTVENSYRYDIQLKSGVKAFLEKLNRDGVKMCVATASDKTLAETALERLDIRKFFVCVLTCNEVGYGKDKPVIYREALRRLGTPKDYTYVFEDAYHAIKTAKKDGFNVVAIYDDYESEQDKIKQLCDYYTTDYSVNL